MTMKNLIKTTVIVIINNIVFWYMYTYLKRYMYKLGGGAGEGVVAGCVSIYMCSPGLFVLS